MSRINKVIQQKEMAVQKRGIPVTNTAIPVYDTMVESLIRKRRGEIPDWQLLSLL